MLKTLYYPPPRQANSTVKSLRVGKKDIISTPGFSCVRLSSVKNSSNTVTKFLQILWSPYMFKKIHCVKIVSVYDIVLSHDSHLIGLSL